MAGNNVNDVILNTLHEDLQAGFSEVKGELRFGFADLKAAFVTGFRNMPSRESQEEMVRLLRENNRLQEERLTQLDIRIREQHLEVQLTLRALTDAVGTLTGEVRNLVGEVRHLAGEVRVMSADIKSLVARIDALIKGRGDGASSP